MKSYNLEHWGEDQRQEAAADGAHQRDDQVQLWDEDGESTCEDDQQSSQHEVNWPLPPLRYTSHNWWDENLGWDVELQGKGDENAKTVEQLHGLVHPAVWQVESDAPSYMFSEAHVSYSAQADVEEGDDAHP